MPTTFDPSLTSSATPRNFLGRLKKSGSPLALTINGNAEVVVHGAEACRELLEGVAIEGIPQGPLT